MERAAKKVLAIQEQTNSELTIVLTDIQEIQTLNREFADTDFPTDVLAFVDGSEDPNSKKIYLGDVIICFPIAEENATRAGHTVEAELALLTIHGVLHLLGFDHDLPHQKEQMWKVQSQVLKELGLDLSIP
jgi:probable rRNA maturation factor